MGFQLSPGVTVTETDLTNVVPSVATSIGGFVGVFQWGPVMDVQSVDYQGSLVKKFGKPNNDTATSFFSVANFLDYTNQARIVRVVGGVAKNATSDGSGLLVKNQTEYEFNYQDAQGAVGEFAARYPGELGNSIQVLMADKATFTTWEYKANFSNPPNIGETANDELHILIVDVNGKFTGVKGGILEKYQFLSKAFDSKSTDGNSNYYKNVINRSSQYVYWMDHPTAVSATGDAWGAPKDGTTFTDLTAAYAVTLSGGVDDNVVTDESIVLSGWGLFTNPEVVDVNLLFVGEASATVSKFVIQNVAEIRRDCIAFVSPPREVSVNNPDVLNATIDWRNNQSFNVSSSYGALDSGWKYQYDQYNDVYRWVPLNADMAGLHARTDDTNDAWWAAGGLNRGQIKNVIKLSWNPGQMERDQLYQAGINPVTSFPGQGIVLFGNKTLLAKPSAFDRINVRRLFIVLEKAISKAARFTLFELNDAFTRSQFVNMISPYLRMVQGRRGIEAFKIVCDETNNDSYIVSTNQFVADIYVRPTYVAEFITLNFIASNNAALFTEQG